MAQFFGQSEFDISLEWGLAGVNALAPARDVLVIVDVLSFTTSVEIVVANRATALPYRGPAQELAAFAAARNALPARHGRTPGAGYSLAPSSLTGIPAATRIVLPSPNGSTLSLAAQDASSGGQILAGCLRNAKAVATAAQGLGQRVGVIAAGERWADGSLRPSLEDLLGAGAILSHLSGSFSPEASAAVAAFTDAQPELLTTLQRCGSGKELIGRGFAEDVLLASQLNVSAAVPRLSQGAYSHFSDSQ